MAVFLYLNNSYADQAPLQHPLKFTFIYSKNQGLLLNISFADQSKFSEYR